MSWMQKLCAVYDSVIGTDGAQGEGALLPVGFIQKAIRVNIILSPDARFVTAQILPETEQLCAIPSTPQAEGRTGDNGAPFPLADQLKYLIAPEGGDNPRLESYLRQLEAWCAFPGAPECLRTLLEYLRKRTLCADLAGVAQLKLKLHRDEQKRDRAGADIKSIACFSIEYPDEQNCLWLRSDVCESWSRYFAALDGGESALCYVTGERLPALAKHPKLLGNAKLISSDDAGFPFRYKGRFSADGSAACASMSASVKAHNALKWLLEHQGFRRFGMSFVGWNVDSPALSAQDFAQDASSGEDGEEERRRTPDTLEAYVNALFRALGGRDDELRSVGDESDLTPEHARRMSDVVLLGLQAATPGRMSITYYQEMPGNQLVERVRAWHDGMRWRMPDKNRPDRAPSWLEICEAVMGADAVQIAKGDFKAEKSATKLMREMQLRLLHCTVNGAALPGDMVGAAFARAVSPLSFTDGKGKWQGFLWARCVATACGMIRRHLQVGREPLEVTPELDMTLRRRDYLYGRLLGVAYRLEQAVNAQPEEKWSSVRMMTRFVQRPAETWPLLYESLLPCLSALGDRANASRNPDDRRWNARLYQRLFGQIERLFTPEDRADTRPLSYLFLVGFHTQRMSLRLDREMRPYAPPATRDELYGCLLAIADDCEWNAERVDGDVVSARDGHTGAMALTRAFARAPSTAWQRIHDGLIPYLESAGVREAGRVQRLIARVEQGFAPQERASDRPLGSLFLHGYLSMRLALAQHSLDMEAWKPERLPAPQPNTREAAFGALLALENDVERRALDLDAPGEENRPSNTMRFLTRAARRPCEVWDYLSARMKPYAGKRWLGASVTDTANALRERIAQCGWDTDEPLRPEYLHDFYLYSGALYAGTPEHREHDRKDD